MTSASCTRRSIRRWRLSSPFPTSTAPHPASTPTRGARRTAAIFGLSLAVCMSAAALLAPSAYAVNVTFADPNLEAAVRTRLSPPIPAIQPITDADMSTLTGLNAVGLAITNLSGLEYAVNLQQLDLSANQINSIAPLSALTRLRSLTMGSNQIQDIAPLQGLTDLNWLVLYDNDIESPAPVAGLVNLNILCLSGNNITDISPLLANPGITGAGDQVEINRNYLDLAPESADVADIRALQARGISLLFDPQLSTSSRAYIDDAALEQAIRSVVTISAVMEITLDDMLSLTHLSATNRGITTLNGLHVATNLTSLDVSGNKLTTIRTLTFNTGLGAGDVVNVTGNDLITTAGSAAMTDINTLISRGVQVQYLPQRRPFRVRFRSNPPAAARFTVNTTVPGSSVIGYSPTEGYSVTQNIDAGKSGQPVTAGNQVFYRFKRWSDGVTSATRSFTNVSADATVTAEFLNVHESQGDQGCFVSGCHDSDQAPNASDWDTVKPGFDLGPQYIAIHDWYAGPGSENAQIPNSCNLCHSNPPVSPVGVRTCTGACHDAVPHQGQAAGHAVTAASSRCTRCHGEDLVIIHKATTDSTKCEKCHDNQANWSKTGDCDSCHTGGAHPHPEAAITGVSAGDGHLCTECHSKDIVAEHSKATSAGSADVCAICHGIGGAREKISGTWDLACDTPACHGEASAQPMHSTYCAGCHENENTDFSVKQTGFRGAQVAKSKCLACHGAGITTAGSYKTGRRWRSARHLSHNATDECASCHYWSQRRTDFYTQAVTGPFGAFASAESTSPTPARAHSVHTSGSWAGEIEFAPNIYCGNCHQATGCTSCHGSGTIPATHASHGTQPTQTVMVVKGAPSYTTLKQPLAAETRSCTSAACHGGAAAKVPTCTSCHTDRAVTHW